MHTGCACPAPLSVMLTRENGISLVELLVGLAAGLIVVTAASHAFIVISDSGYSQLRRLRLEHELRSVLQVMKRDLRRAGYWNWQPGMGLSLVENPFMSEGFRPLTGRASASEAADSCVTFSYDLDRDGLVNAASMELFGYRLRDGAIEMRSSGTSAACSDGIWQDITMPTIRITLLKFTIDRIPHDLAAPELPCTAAQPCRHDMFVTVDLGGELVDAAEIRYRIRDKVGLHNARISIL